MDIKGIDYEDFTRSFMELAEEKKKCAVLEGKMGALQGEIQRLEEQHQRDLKLMEELKEQNRLMTIQATAMSLKELFYMGQYRLSTEKMRAELSRCMKMNDGLTANIMLRFALAASLYELDDESKRLIESMLPSPTQAINYSGTIINNGGTLNGEINNPRYE